MNVHIITVGDEILIGQVVDTNSAWMGQRLNLIGASIERIISIGDDHDTIVSTIQSSLREADAVLMTGGLGPTKDDITKKAIAGYFGVKMTFDQGTLERVEKVLARFNRPMTEQLKEQCYVPENAVLLHNKMGTAPGMWFEQDGAVLVSMPGVPYEMQYLMENEVLPRLKGRLNGKPIAHRTVLTSGEGESFIAARIEKFEADLPANVKLAYLPSLGQVRLRLTGRDADEERLNRLLDDLQAQLVALIPDLVFGFGSNTLEAAVGELLLDRGLSLATAESCTGGYVAHLITSIPGSSRYFKGSVVAYANEVKQMRLGVKPATLAAYGAVSEETVREMAEGALDAIGVDVAVSISGIAGPDGGTPEKPVGTIWMAVADKKRTEAVKILAGRDRARNIDYAAVRALDFLRRFLAGHYPLPGKSL
ncbi:MAG TPA: competence/damage-inducible protein A [Flavilitoribacter sp.]|mgnify:CR=1 FL=1|nr:competence/damage-inducible protein A [Flavilitoribacter sp.]